MVCDATCLERNLNLVLQTLEITPRVVVCVNLMDEAKKRKSRIEPARLEALLGVPVVGCTAPAEKHPGAALLPAGAGNRSVKKTDGVLYAAVSGGQ